MTIKQQGGIFGRNPTFNDVGAENLTASTSISSPLIDTLRLTDDGSSGLRLYSKQSGGRGLIFASGIIYPSGNSGATNNNGTDLGTAGVRFKDIYTNNVKLASGGGIDFSATSGTGTSELFDDYEEGTWTPTVAGDATGALTGAEAGTYTKVGRLVNVQFQFAVNTNFSSNLIGGLPYTPYIQSSISSLYGAVPVNTSSGSIYAVVQDTSTNILFYSNLSGTTHNPNTTSTFYRVALSYVTS